MKLSSSVLVLSALVLSACGQALPSLTVTSPDFAPGGAIPVRYTCDGGNIPPPLHIDGVPAGAKTLAVLMHEPDGEKGEIMHWAMWNVPAGQTDWKAGEIPVGATQAQNDALVIGYSGPCRVQKEVHHYEFDVYALDSELTLMSGADRPTIEKTFRAHVLADGSLTGTYLFGQDEKKTQPL